MSYGLVERKRQSSFRDSSPSISTAARTPCDPKMQRNGHLLAVGYEVENLYDSLRRPGGAKDFFADRNIHWWRSSRSGDDTSVNGPTRNMASSQIACLNFLLPLKDNAAALTALLRSLAAGIRGVVPIRYVPHGSISGAQVDSLVDFEWIGEKAPLEQGAGYTRGEHATSVDALLIGKSAGGATAFLIEWKYVEEYEVGKYLGAGKPGATRLRRYSGMYSAPNSPFSGIAPVEELLYDPLYQIARLLLLGQRMVQERELGVTDFRVVVVCPEANDDYRNRITSPDLRKRFPNANSIEHVMRQVLRGPSIFVMTSPEKLLSEVRGSGAVAGLAAWSAYMRERYGW